MRERALLIGELRNTTEGSSEFDARIARLLYPDKQIVVSDDGVPCFAEAESHMPVPRYTASLDAKIPGEDVLRVERLTEGSEDRWRVWLADGCYDHGRTEAIARRVARLTQIELDEQEAKPNPRKPYDSRSRYAKHRDNAKKAKQSISAGSFTSDAERLMSDDDIANHKLIIEVLCEHIRNQRINAPGPAPELLPDKTLGDSTIRIRWRSDAQPMVTKESTTSTATIMDVLAMWHAEARPRRTRLEGISRATRRLVELHGNRPVNSYTKGEVREFLSKIRRLPKHPPPQIRGLPMPALVRYADENPGIQRVTPAAVIEHLKSLRHLFNWAISADLCAQNPVNGLSVVDHRHPSELRVGYDIEDLKLIFERSTLYTGCKGAHRRREPGNIIVKDALFWFPLFGLFTGARLGEIANARLEDFKSLGGTPYFDITADGQERFLKTPAAFRRVPIHQELVKMGFLGFVERTRQLGYVKVFERLEGRRDISCARNWTQAWRIYQADLAIEDRRKVFHSFRHSFKSACREAGVEEELHDALTGHRGGYTGRKYGGGYSLEKLAEAVAKVEYQGLDLSHLYECKPSPN